MAKRKALGKGLSALIPDAAPVEEFIEKGVGKVTHGDLFTVKVGDIIPNRYQPRKDFDDEKIEELAASVEENGIIQPLIVRSSEDGYELIAGERRLRAAKRAGLERVPVVIKDVSDSEILQLALIENIQREDLNPIEEANAYLRLIEEFDITQENLAGRVGKDRSTIANTLRLLSLPDVVKEDVARGVLSSGHARALLSLNDERSILKARERVTSKGMSVRETESLVKRMKEGEPEKLAREVDHLLLDIEDELTRTLGTRVKIVSRGAGGKIEIEYYSDQELERLTDILKS
ncbi:MAG: ParB/RepB/Spo0J family partition protein [Deltaproteobacteria bacterium]|uniref:ParB/RepB/Spo0J family partition protein n=1 Tax=Candidatus Zymogenus saltonus TaxID=2844893 RepID=A0A9D8PMW4_9DELT|nr:ParB/RepB/Spo0J family partition protein [Candidatus Zymogenus saltonus]